MPIGERDEISSEFEIMNLELLKNMCTDENASVRKITLKNIDCNEGTIPHILKRIRDKDPDIRRNVFLKLLKDKILL